MMLCYAYLPTARTKAAVDCHGQFKYVVQLQERNGSGGGDDSMTRDSQPIFQDFSRLGRLPGLRTTNHPFGRGKQYFLHTLIEELMLTHGQRYFQDANMATHSVKHEELLTILRNPTMRSDAETIRVRQALQEAEEQEALIEQEIQSLQKKREGILALKQKYMAVLAPIRRLPNEILSLIFEECASGHPLLDWNWSVDRTRRPPLLFMQICKHWCDVVVSTPKMWSNIDVVIGDYVVIGGLDEGSQCSALCLWLQRSGRCPLDINLSIHEDGRFKAEIEFCLRVLNEHSNRWRTLNLYIPSQFLKYLQPARGCMQSLEHIKIMWEDQPDESSIVIDAFEVAPSLRKVELFEESSHYRLPWNKITECNLSMSAHGALAAFRQMTALVDCQISGCWEDEPYEPTTSNMRSLHIAENAEMTSVFSNLTLPSLRTFTCDTEGDPGWPNIAFLAMAQRSGFGQTLTQFILRSASEMEPNDLIACLEHLPNLLELEVDWVEYVNDEDEDETVCSTFDQSLVDGFTISDHNLQREDYLCPGLTKLRLWGRMSFDDYSFAAMVRSRLHTPSNHVCRIQSIDLQYHRDWDKGAISGLERLASEGRLDLSCQLVSEESRASLPYNIWN